MTLTDVKLLFLILWEFHENRTVTIRISNVCNCFSLSKKEEVFTLHYISECNILLVTSEYADFQLLYIAVALNAVIYFHSYVLYFGYILVLLSGITDPIGVLTYGQEDETLHFCL